MLQFDFKVDLDVTRRRLFLKRTVVPSLRLEDLFIGAKVSVCSRVLTVLDYADSTTRNTFASKQEKYESLLTIDMILIPYRTLALIAANSDMGKVLSLISEKSPANNGGNSSRGTTPRSARPRDESFHSGFVVERMRCVYLTSKEVLGFQRAGAGHRYYNLVYFGFRHSPSVGDYQRDCILHLSYTKKMLWNIGYHLRMT